MSDGSTTTRSCGASAVSGHLDTRTAAMELAEQLDDGIGGRCDLVVFFASYHHRAAFAEAAESIRETLHPRVMLGVTAESVLGGDQELEGLVGMSALALRMPGATLHPWSSSPDDPILLSQPETIPDRIGITSDFRAAIVLADPYTTPMSRLLPALTDAGGAPRCIVGGIASGASQPGHNALLLDEQVSAAGAVGVSIGGNVSIDTVLSQGCRPIGRPLVITKVNSNVILELGGHPAIAALQEVGGELSEGERELLGKGLLIGTVINEHKHHWGRGDFLIRNVLGLNQKLGGIVAGEMPRVGQTIQFHVRDAMTASEDLQLLLDAQELHEPPFGALLFTCNGRGQRLFEEPNHDTAMIRDRLHSLPIAGLFAAGEIGPIGERSFLHGHTASLVLFR
jgi:small ligand-binding sensory domain FIST